MCCTCGIQTRWNEWMAKNPKEFQDISRVMGILDTYAGALPAMRYLADKIAEKTNVQKRVVYQWIRDGGHSPDGF